MAQPLLVSGGTGELLGVPVTGWVSGCGPTLPTSSGYATGAFFVKTGSDAGLYVNAGDVDGADFIGVNATPFDNTFTIGRTADDPPTLTQRVLTSSNPRRRAFKGVSLWESEVLVSSSVNGTVGTPGKFITDDASTDFMEVSHCRIDGQQSAGNGGSATHTMNGVVLRGQYCRTDHCFLENFAGSAIKLASTQTAHDNLISGVINGIHVTSSDTHVTHNRSVNDFQNAGVLIDSGVGTTVVADNHFFAGLYAFKDEGAGGTRSSGNTYADSHFGVWCAGAAATFTGDVIQQNKTRGMYIGGTSCAASNVTVNCQKQVDQSGSGLVTGCIGVEVLDAGDRFSFMGGKIELTDYSHGSETNAIVANCALKVAADDCVFITRLIDNDGVNGSIGVRISGAIKGGHFEFFTNGFTHSTDRLLIIDNVGLRGCTFIFKGPGLDTTTPANLVDVADNWKPADSGNSIVITNTTTGASVSLDDDAY